jgi:HPt (histidine-containing phosphotransfer) domain-containing protein
MDEYLSKPIRAKQLAVILETLMLDEPSQTMSTFNVRSESLPMGSLIDWKTALEGVDGDRELLKSVVEVFLDESQQLLNDLTLAVHAHDVARVRSRGHSLKGAMLGVGAFATADLAQSLEMGAGSESLQSMTASLQNLEQQYARIVVELRKFLAS